MCKEIGVSDSGRRGFCQGGGTVWNTLKGGGTEKSGEEAKILKRSGQSGSRGGCLKEEGSGAGTSYELKLVYHSWYMKKFFTNFVLKYTIHFWVELKKTANADGKLLWQPY